MAAILRGRDCLASLLFVLALNYKQMELYHALPFFCYLLGLSLHQPSALAKLGKLARIGVTVLATFAVVWAPFILLGQDSVLQVLLGFCTPGTARTLFKVPLELCTPGTARTLYSRYC